MLSLQHSVLDPCVDVLQSLHLERPTYLLEKTQGMLWLLLFSLSVCLHACLAFFVSLFLAFFLSFFPSFFPSFLPSLLSFFLSFCLSLSLSESLSHNMQHGGLESNKGPGVLSKLFASLLSSMII